MSKISFHKVLDTLPDELMANSVYYVKRGVGYDTYVTSDESEGGEVVSITRNYPPLLHTTGDSVDFAVSQKGMTNVVGDVWGMLQAINSGEWDGMWQSSWDGELDGRFGKVDRVEGKSLISDDEIMRLLEIEDGATKNAPDEYLLDRANHTGDLEMVAVSGLLEELDLTVKKEDGRSLAYDSDVAKLRLLSDDEIVLDRANHTGEQSIDTIIGLSVKLETLTTEIETLNTTMGDITTILDEILGETP